MLVRILTTRTFKAHCFTYPIRVFKSQLRDHGIKVKFHFKPDPELCECDVLCLILDALIPSRLNPKPPDRFEFLEMLRGKTETIIWFDTVDGTGTPSFSVLPYVDLYAKNQLFRDKTLYTKVFYGNELFTDYYHRVFGIDDGNFSSQLRMQIDVEQIKKLAISWNIGLGDYTTFSPYWRHLRMFTPKLSYNFKSSSVYSNRTIDISFRGRTQYKQSTFSYQRQQTQKLLSQLAHETNYLLAYSGIIPYREYKEEISRARLVISPFGLGEICFRDFECFLGGAMLFKPDMSHLESWPDFYIENKTYIPYAWDFSDFNQKLIECLESTNETTQIALAGQDNYLNMTAFESGETLINHFSSLLIKAKQMENVSITN